MVEFQKKTSSFGQFYIEFPERITDLGEISLIRFSEVYLNTFSNVSFRDTVRNNFNENEI